MATNLFEADFTSFTGSGFTPTPLVLQLDSDFWRVTGLSDGEGTFGDTFISGDFARGTNVDGGVSTGGVYAFTTDAGTNTILGVQPSSSDFTPGTITLKLTNTTGATITDLGIAYDIFFNNDATRANSLNFAYSLDDSTYIPINDLDFTTPEAVDSLGFQSINLSNTITGLNIADGADFYLQWQGADVSGSGSRDEYGIDNVVITDESVVAVSDVWINEIHYDNDGSDSSEGIEVAGTAGTDLSGWSIELYNGNGGSIYDTINLTGTLADHDNGFGTLFFPQSGIQNGSPDGLALIDDGDNVIQFLSYEGTLTAVDGSAVGLTSTDIGVSETSSTPVGFSLQLQGTGTTYDDFTWSDPLGSTYNEVNTGQSFAGIVTQPLVINEVLGSTSGTDVEYIELFGEAGTSLDGLSIIVVESDAGTSNGTIDSQVDLGAGDEIGDNGFFLIGNTAILESSVYAVTPNTEIESNFIENSSYTIALVETSSIAGSTVSGSEVVIDTVGVSDGDVGDTFFFSAPILGPDGTFLPAGVRRVEDGADTDTVEDWVFGDFALGSDNTPTAGTGDSGGEPDLVFIHQIQGTSPSSPLEGTIVTVEAIVIGDFQDGDDDIGRNLTGFYLQEEDADADADDLTSEGIFVFQGGDFINDVNVGDLVQVTGTVDEFFGETQIDTIIDISLISSGNPLPTAASISLPTTETTTNQDGDLQPDLEAYEGMLVTFPQTLTITEMFQLDRFNEIKLSEGGRLEQFTQNNTPDVDGYNAHLQDVGSRTITYDDGLNEQNVNISNLDGFGPTFNTATDIRMGDTINNLSGVLNYQWAGNSASGATWRVRSTIDGENNFTKVNERSTAPDDVGGTLKVASLNVLNYFTTLDVDGNPGSGPNNLDPRGADNLDEFNRQQEKLVTAIIDMDADILGLVELENTDNAEGEDIVLSNLVTAINTELGSEVYDYISTGFIGGDAIKVGLIYKASTATPVGDFAILDSSVDPTFIDDRNRPALAQTFTDSNGGEFTIAVNHFKSKGQSGLSDTSDPDFDQGDGAGFWNATRTDAANALANWLATDPTNSGDSDFLIVGDLNSYAQETPITALEAAGYTDLVEEFVGTDAYSFVFDGQVGTLDYAFANSTLLDQVTGTTEWHINADEPDALDYNLDFGRDPAIFDGTVPFRTSDHDPIIIGLDLSSPLNEITGTNRRDVLIGTDGNDLITGLRRGDKLIGGAGNDIFAYNSLRDGIDKIIDFEVGSDLIDISRVLESFNYLGSDPIEDYYLQFADRRGDTIVKIDPDGSGFARARALVRVIGVSSEELNNLDNFII